MSRKLLSSTAIALFAGSGVMADAPNVAVDIAPLHSLVARVMDGVGTPELVIPPGASPHEYNLRPSEAAALENADVVFWIGEDLTPWLEDAVETLAEDAAVTAVLEADGVELLEFREGLLFEEHDHGDHDDHGHEDHADGDHDDHGHEEHADEDHDDHDHEAHAEKAEDDHDHDEHAEEGHGDHDDHGHDDHAGHDHGAHDPHAWLSPDNASTWLNVIAAQLSAADPDNAGVYFENAAAAREEMEALKAELSATLEPVRGTNFIVFHDAYQYFETAFDIPTSGAITLGDATDPSPGRIAEIQERVRAEGIACVASEPQYNPGLVATVLDGTDAKTVVLDPLGSSLEPGVDLYAALLRDLAGGLADCL
ncbi:MAG: zinc ABC transporter substrate-binding protein [Pseudomonadota bacterium]